jgi:predicted patatin/cPLA2 family phospholipase
MTSSERPEHHPVSQVLAERARSASRPGQREDGATVALVIEGGGMRGVVAAGMVAALEQLGLGEAFDAVYGTSSGAIAGAMFLARQSERGASAYYEELVDGPFVDFRRLLRGQPIVSLDYLFNWVIPTAKDFDLATCVSSPTPFTIVATRIEEGAYSADYLTEFTDESDLLACLRGSCTVPLACGPPLRVRDGLYVDGALTESIPIRAARSPLPDGRQPTHTLALLTRPSGELRHPPNLLDRCVLFPFMNRQTPGLGHAHLPMAESYGEELELLASTPNTLVIARPAEALHVGRLEQDARVVTRGAIEGATVVHQSLTGRAPRLHSALASLDGSHGHVGS